jgi:CRAL/TRIO domain/CRAL/TRIO, N-terminal domain
MPRGKKSGAKSGKKGGSSGKAGKKEGGNGLLEGEIPYFRDLTAEETEGIAALRARFAGARPAKKGKKRAARKQEKADSDGSERDSDASSDDGDFDWETLEWRDAETAVDVLLERHWDAAALLDQAHLLRFLRARKFDVDAATELLVRDIAWRKAARPEALEPEQFPEASEKGFVMKLPIRTLKGHGVVQIFPATYLPGMVSHDQMLKTFLYTIEAVFRDTEAGRDPRYVVLYDRTKMARKNVDMDLLKKFGALLEAHYPETIEEIAIMYSDMMFRTIWKAAKYFFDKETAAKIKIPTPSGWYGGDWEAATTKYLLQHLEERTLPAKYGGALTDFECGYHRYPHMCETIGIEMPATGRKKGGKKGRRGKKGGKKPASSSSSSKVRKDSSTEKIAREALGVGGGESSESGGESESQSDSGSGSGAAGKDSASTSEAEDANQDSGSSASASSQE